MFAERIRDIVDLTPEQMVNHLKKIHTLLAKTLYQTKKQKTKPGEFRTDIEYVLRHTLSGAGYTLPNQYARIALFLEKNTPNGKHVAVNFLTGYFKLFILPTNNQIEIEKFKFAISAYHTRCFGKPYDHDLTAKLTQDENQALERIYHLYIDHNKIENALLNLCKAILSSLKSDDDPRKMFAEFYMRFIDIHPYADGNARVIKMLLNIILYRKGYDPIMLEDNASRHYFEHFYGKNPSIEVLFKHIIKLAKPGNRTTEVEYKGPGEEEYLERLSDILGEYGSNTKLVQVDKAVQKARFPSFWMENLGKEAIGELSKELKLPEKVFRRT